MCQTLYVLPSHSESEQQQINQAGWLLSGPLFLLPSPCLCPFLTT